MQLLLAICDLLCDSLIVYASQVCNTVVSCWSPSTLANCSLERRYCQRCTARNEEMQLDVKRICLLLYCAAQAYNALLAYWVVSGLMNNSISSLWRRFAHCTKALIMAHRNTATTHIASCVLYSVATTTTLYLWVFCWW